MATDNIKNYPQYTEFQDSDRVKIYSKKNKLAPVSISLGELKDQIVADAVAEAITDIGYTAPLYAEVDINAAEILTLGTVGVTLLPAPSGANEYYSINNWSIEYTHVTTAYTTPARQAVCIGNSLITSIDSSILLGSGQDCVVSGYGLSGGKSDSATLYMMLIADVLQQGVYLFTQDFADPTLGDGTMKVKIWYYIRTFG